MEVFCLEEFRSEFLKLKKNNSYRDLEKSIVSEFFNSPKQLLKHSTRITGPLDIPFVKKRVDGSGGYRTYFLFFVKKEKLFLMFIHPKTGSKGASNITKDFEKEIYKKVLHCIKEKDYYSVTLQKRALTFKHILIDKKDLKEMGELVKSTNQTDTVEPDSI